MTVSISRAATSITMVELTIHAEDAKEAANSTRDQKPSYFRQAEWKVLDLAPPHVGGAEGGGDGHANEEDLSSV